MMLRKPSSRTKDGKPSVAGQQHANQTYCRASPDESYCRSFRWQGRCAMACHRAQEPCSRQEPRPLNKFRPEPHTAVPNKSRESSGREGVSFSDSQSTWASGKRRPYLISGERNCWPWPPSKLQGMGTPECQGSLPPASTVGFTVSGYVS